MNISTDTPPSQGVLTLKFLVLGETYSFYVSVEIISISSPAEPFEMKITHLTRLLRFGKEVIFGSFKNIIRHG